MCESSEAVAVDHISKKFGSVVAVQPTSFVVPAGTLLTLLGPSGSGKTTILKIIAGFEDPSGGTVRIAGRDVTTVPPYRRNLGFVFQQYALFPHLTVAANIAYPLKMRRLGTAETRVRVAEAISLVKLDGLEGRRPAQLSGGQQQRVALARAIVFRPPVLLMDEPMAALDKRLREEMQFEIRRLQRMLGITTVAVTHDQTEALVMSDQIVVLNNGRIEQVGPPQEVYKRPRSEFVANFLGESNIFRGTIRKYGPVAMLDCGGVLQIPLRSSRELSEATNLTYIIRPECIFLQADSNDEAVELRGRVIETIFSGDSLRILVDARAEAPVVAKLLARQSIRVPEPGQQIALWWKESDATKLYN